MTDQSNDTPSQLAGIDQAANVSPAAAVAQQTVPTISEDRIKALVESYEHGLVNNGPRTAAELAELKALLGA